MLNWIVTSTLLRRNAAFLLKPRQGCIVSGETLPKFSISVPIWETNQGVDDIIGNDIVCLGQLFVHRTHLVSFQGLHSQGYKSL